ncbi:hypothetical protein [Micromonospora sagamiensis]|uniref:Uncharacterized protein n=1 Tax=Micromonospora sagamiensis TaxID=47875 RepID=A0A562WG31_9ACTN|nr:hypothetical protein [Micromonospora sagamiensis]TWJ28867.1 hypothetical protein JD81_02373 [Micromonospora sagamiensis]BCL18106.1 hypothetical protein GCM10017556_58450 [Micromonospora sagamiensis]
MTQPTLPTGARLVGPAHAGVCGTWWRALAPDGTDQLVLRIATPDPALADRVIVATRAVAALRHGGLFGPGDPIRHNGALWLVATGASGSTLSELAETEGVGLDVPAVATIAVETARTLVAVHAAGLGHGAVHGRTVVVSGLGAVTLTETALLPALHGVPADPATDRRAWAELVRWLVARWCGTQPGADLLLRCASRGEQDLAQAVRELRDTPLPVGSDGRTGLLAAVTAHRHRATSTEDQGGSVPTEAFSAGAVVTEAWPTAAVATESFSTAAVPTEAFPGGAVPTESFPTAAVATEAFATAGPGVSPGGSTPTEAFTLGGSADVLPGQADTALSMPPPVDPFVSTRVPTLLPDQPSHTGRTYRSVESTVTAPPPVTTDATAAAPGPTTESYRPTGRPKPAGPPPLPSTEVRFGPGVPGGPPTAPGWQRPPAPPRRSRWRLVGSVLSTLLTLALLVAVGLHLWQRMSPLEIRSVRVTVAEPPGERCDVTVDVVATVETNGRAGTIRYQWLRDGAEPGGLLTQRVSRGQRTVTLRLKWAFSGTGSTTETAVINITDPTPTQGRTVFRYQCPTG